MITKILVALLLVAVVSAVPEKQNLAKQKRQILRLLAKVDALSKRMDLQEEKMASLRKEKVAGPAKKQGKPKEETKALAVLGEPLHPQNAIAFHVVKLASFTAVGNEVVINFEQVKSNFGDGWSDFTRAFVAPSRGFYLFQITCYSTNLSPCHGWIRHNQDDVQFVHAASANNAASATAIISLEVDDAVTFTLRDGYSIRGETRSHFAGFLVHPL